MRHSLTTGEGIVVLTGRPGIGKSTLVQWFLEGFEEDELFCATLSSTKVEGEDLLRMVAYAFGLEAQGLDKATLLHELQRHLESHRRSLLVIDEAQNLSTSALEEVRMLTNLQAGARPLLQIFLVGQDRLHEQLHSPQMEQLHQRLVVSCTLEPLNLRETRDYIVHRLNCAGWLENPEISPEVFVLVHRYAQGLPRHINQVCTQLFLHGAIEKRSRLELDDVVSVALALQRDNLMPLIQPEGLDSAEGLPPLGDLVRSAGKPVEQRLTLCSEELVFLAERSALLSVRHESSVHRFQPVDSRMTLPKNLPESTWRYGSGAVYAAVIGIALVAAYQFGLRGGEQPEQGVFLVSPVLASLEEPVPMLKPLSPAVNSRVYRTPLRSEYKIQFDYSQMPGRILDTVSHTESRIVVEKTLIKEPRSSAPRIFASEPVDSHEVTAREDEITQLLLLGDEALASNRLKRPKDENALYYYTEALKLAPGHLKAEFGIRQIVERYGTLVEREIGEQHFRLAQLYIDRAMSISPADVQLAALQAQLSTEQQALVSRLEKDQLLALSQSAVNDDPVESEEKSGGLLDLLKTFFAGEKNTGSSP